MHADTIARVERGLYSLAIRLGIPLLLYHLVWRGLRYPQYFRRWHERFGYFDPLPVQPRIWLHAVSVGEVNAAAPLVEALRVRYPDHAILVTTTTPTGSERVRKLWGDAVEHAYLPYDIPGAVERFFDRSRPDFGIIMETELWPNLYFAARARGLQLLIANARLSARSLRRYAPFKALLRRVIDGVAIAAQSEHDAHRLRALGAQEARLSIVGNLKFHLHVPEGLVEAATGWRNGWGAQRPVWVAASTHPDEEAAVLGAHQTLLGREPGALLIWAPRHPERFEAVTGAAQSRGLRVATRRAHGLPEPDTSCFVLDTLGELVAFLACADLVFVGGSLQPVGGHNVLEPAALGVPVLVGPHTFNFAAATALLARVGALETIADAQALGRSVVAILADPGRRMRMGAAARTLVEEQRGALAKTMALVEDAYRPDDRHAIERLRRPPGQVRR